MEAGTQDTDYLVGKIIAHAATAGSCRAWARREPAAAAGLLKAAGFHSRRVTALIDELLARREVTPSAAPHVRPTLGGWSGLGRA